ncbi:MAG: hypothetical protein IKQ61_00510 [Spirochaetales bacterium]|nr:hypothetical protein [Spirochaetales bacterium]
MRTRKRFTIENPLSFDLSISDLMAALCGIFILILLVMIVQLNNQKAEYERQNRIVEDYNKIQREISILLRSVVNADLQSEWERKGINIDVKENRIVFSSVSENDALFGADDIEPTKICKELIDALFPELIDKIWNSINDNAFDDVEEIRIEGHTSSSKKLSAWSNYINGSETSCGRARKVLEYYLYKNPESSNLKKQEWRRKILVPAGYSNTHPVADKFSSKNRRIEFRIVTNSEKYVNEKLDIHNVNNKHK